MIAIVIAALVAFASQRLLGFVPWALIACGAALLLFFPVPFVLLLLVGGAAFLLTRTH